MGTAGQQGLTPHHAVKKNQNIYLILLCLWGLQTAGKRNQLRQDNDENWLQAAPSTLLAQGLQEQPLPEFPGAEEEAP